MTQPFIGEIQIMGFNFNPRGWAFCNGATLPISQNTALFSLIGVIYGGNGQTTFQLPNFAGRAGMSQGNGPGLTPTSLGQSGGVQSVTLTTNQIPNHGHTLTCGVPTTPTPAQQTPIPGPTALLGQSGPNSTYSDVATPAVAFNPAAIATYGASQAHENRQPYLGLNIVIALQGIYPSFP